MEKKITYLDRNEYNYGPCPAVGEVLKNFDPNNLCFYTRIYDEGKKSIFSDYLSSIYNIPEKQIILGYGGEDILKQVVHCFLSGKEKQKTLLIPKFSWWYYKSIADEVEGRSVLYPLYEEGNTFKYDFEALTEKYAKDQWATDCFKLMDESWRSVGHSNSLLFITKKTSEYPEGNYITNALENGHKVRGPSNHPKRKRKSRREEGRDRVAGIYMYHMTDADVVRRLTAEGAREIEKKAMAYLEGNG